MTLSAAYPDVSATGPHMIRATESTTGQLGNCGRRRWHTRCGDARGGFLGLQLLQLLPLELHEVAVLGTAWLDSVTVTSLRGLRTMVPNRDGRKHASRCSPLCRNRDTTRAPEPYPSVGRLGLLSSVWGALEFRQSGQLVFVPWETRSTVTMSRRLPLLAMLLLGVIGQ